MDWSAFFAVVASIVTFVCAVTAFFTLINSYIEDTLTKRKFTIIITLAIVATLCVATIAGMGWA